jgi:hypothetical protein
MKLLSRVLTMGLFFSSSISLCISATAQTPLLSGQPVEPAIAFQQDILPDRLNQNAVVRPGQMADVGGIFNRNYGRLVLDDISHTVTAPLRWGPNEWRQMGLAGAAILGTGVLLDRPIRNAAQRHQNHSLDRVADFFEPFGSQRYAIGILGGFYLVSLASDDAKAMHVAQDGLASSLIASAMITPILNEVVGRKRPRANEGVARFYPFGGRDNSFPSGHATEAFAIASVIAAHYDTPWVTTVTYGTAGLVGFARVYHNAHFTSDVLAGALIGAVVGNSIVAFNQQQRTSKVSFMPMLAPGASGLMMQIRF